jgi:hypothetical protein
VLWRVLFIFVIVLTAGALLAAPVATGCTADCGSVVQIDDCCEQEAPGEELPRTSNSCDDCSDCMLCHASPVPTFVMAVSTAGQGLLPSAPLDAAPRGSISVVFQVPPTPPPRA